MSGKFALCPATPDATRRPTGKFHVEYNVEDGWYNYAADRSPNQDGFNHLEEAEKARDYLLNQPGWSAPVRIINPDGKEIETSWPAPWRPTKWWEKILVWLGII